MKSVKIPFLNYLNFSKSDTKLFNGTWLLRFISQHFITVTDFPLLVEKGSEMNHAGESKM